MPPHSFNTQPELFLGLKLDFPISERIAFPDVAQRRSSVQCDAAASVNCVVNPAENWGLEEDRMIIKSFDFQLPPSKQLVKDYIAAAKARPSVFAKPAPSMESFVHRHAELVQSLTDRYRMLKADIELEAIRGERVSYSAEVEEQKEATPASQLIVTVYTADASDVRTYQLDKQQASKHSSMLRHLGNEKGTMPATS